MRSFMTKLFVVFSLALSCKALMAQTLAEVSTAWRLFGSHKIVVEVFEDPLVNGVACYVSRAKKGGLTGAIGLAEDPSNASIACRQVGPISFKGPVGKEDDVFSVDTSILFKTLKVIRIADPQRQVLAYLTVSTKLIDGSPQNAITAVPVNMPIPIKR